VSSHREAPYISSDPVADNTDVYAFVSPDAPDTVTIIANFIPLEAPAGGPNFYQFGDDVLYEINISNSGTKTDISYQFTFSTAAPNPAAGFLYNTGPITSLSDPTWNRRQTYDVTKVKYDGTKGGNASRVGSSLPCPPCNIGPLSTPNYSSLAAAAVKTLATGRRYSPASGPTRSSSISARSSTSATCGPSPLCTPAAAHSACTTGSTRSAPRTSTRSPFRSRRRC
jgi:Domain of unknown function (DUF4331)